MKAANIRDERLLSPKEVAARVAVSTSTIYRLINEGKLRAIKVRGSLRVKGSALAEYVERGGRF